MWDSFIFIILLYLYWNFIGGGQLDENIACDWSNLTGIHFNRLWIRDCSMVCTGDFLKKSYSNFCLSEPQMGLKLVLENCFSEIILVTISYVWAVCWRSPRKSGTECTWFNRYTIWVMYCRDSECNISLSCRHLPSPRPGAHSAVMWYSLEERKLIMVNSNEGSFIDQLPTAQNWPKLHKISPPAIHKCRLGSLTEVLWFMIIIQEGLKV